MRLPLSGFVVVGVLHLGGQFLAPGTWLPDLTQVLLMPVLLWTLIAGLRERHRSIGRLGCLTSIALAFSWCGDTVPRFVAGDAGFLTMVGCFFLAQLTYIAAFLPLRHRSLAWRRPITVTPYALGFVALLLLCRDGAGDLLAPVVAYGIALATMAVLATGLPAPGAVGGALFFVSDALIALGAFADLDLLAGTSFWVMLTYIVGQAMLVLGVPTGPGTR